MDSDHSVRFCYAARGKGYGKGSDNGDERGGRKEICKAGGKGSSKGISNNNSKGSSEGASKGYNSGGNLRKGISTGSRNQILITYSKQISELGKTGQWWQALQLFDSMQQQGVVPNVITYSTLISACGKGKQPDHCGRCIRCSDLDYGSPLGVACDPPASLGPTPPVSVAAVARGAIPSNIPSAISFPVSSSKRGKAKAKAAGYFGHSKDAPPTGGICKYSGSYNEVGQRHGTGTLLWENGDQYEGKFWNGHLDGEGALYFPDGSNYEGNFCLSKMDGTGTRRFSNGNVYTGEYCEGRRAGQGRCYFSNGDIYHGGWKADLIHGFGRYYYATGRAYEGNFLSGQRVGRGKLQLVDGSVDIYRYVKDKRVGDGVRWSQDRKNAWRLDENGEKKEAVSIAEAMHLANQCGLAVKV